MGQLGYITSQIVVGIFWCKTENKPTYFEKIILKFTLSKVGTITSVTTTQDSDTTDLYIGL